MADSIAHFLPFRAKNVPFLALKWANLIVKWPWGARYRCHLIFNTFWSCSFLDVLRFFEEKDPKTFKKHSETQLNLNNKEKKERRSEFKVLTKRKKQSFFVLKKKKESSFWKKETFLKKKWSSFKKKVKFFLKKRKMFLKKKQDERKKKKFCARFWKKKQTSSFFPFCLIRRK